MSVQAPSGPVQVIAVYSQDAYPSGNVFLSIEYYQNTKVNTLIISGLNGVPGEGIVYNYARNLMFDTCGHYVGDSDWAASLQLLTAQTLIDPSRLFVSLSDSAIVVLAGMTQGALAKVMMWFKTHGIKGVDMDCKQLSPMSGPVTKVTLAAIHAGLALTAAPCLYTDHWQHWCNLVSFNCGVVAWLNLPCYALGIVCDPVQWSQYFEQPVPLVPGFTANPSELGYLTPSQTQRRLAKWQAECTRQPLTGAFTRQKGATIDFKDSVKCYAEAIFRGLSGRGCLEDSETSDDEPDSPLWASFAVARSRTSAQAG